MTKWMRTHKLWLMFGGVALVIGCLFIWWLVQGNMINTTRTWARLDPLPSGKNNYSIETCGGMFSREFKAEFSAPLPEIVAWLDSSPGTRDVVPELQGDNNSPIFVPGVPGGAGLGKSGTWVYAIEPGGGAQFARVTVDVETGYVKIRTYWS